MLKKKEAERYRHSMQEWEKEQKKEQCWKKEDNECKKTISREEEYK